MDSRQTEIPMATYDIVCIGAGPTGLACAIEARRAGMRPLVIDKGCLCNSIYHYPVNMVFFYHAGAFGDWRPPAGLRRGKANSG